jgi:hypothetical protein
MDFMEAVKKALTIARDAQAPLHKGEWIKDDTQQHISKQVMWKQVPWSTPMCADARIVRASVDVEEDVEDTFFFVADVIDDAERFAREAILDLFPERCEGKDAEVGSLAIIAAFNDHADTTIEDVRKMLTEAINRAEAASARVRVSFLKGE